MEEDLPDLSLIIVAGTSLTVFPAAYVAKGGPKTKRVVCNREIVGKNLGLFLDEERNDVFIGSDCDDAFIAIA